jgi:hypothetical protein
VIAPEPPIADMAVLAIAICSRCSKTMNLSGLMKNRMTIQMHQGNWSSQDIRRSNNFDAVRIVNGGKSNVWAGDIKRVT